jgi:hypothetical protein
VDPSLVLARQFPIKEREQRRWAGWNR